MGKVDERKSNETMLFEEKGEIKRVLDRWRERERQIDRYRER